MKKYTIGVDLGGTKVLCALVEKQTNKILFEVKKKTKKEKGNKKVTQKLIEAIDELLENSKIELNEVSSIGLALAGQVDRQNGILINGCNLQCQNLNLKEVIKDKYNLDVYVANDVEASAIAEMKLGAGVGYKNVLCVFVGTGVGSSIVINGKIHHGNAGCAGEIGHIIVDLNGRNCACGGVGCLEAYASRSAIEARIQGAIKKNRQSVITNFCDGQNISTKHIKKAMDALDEVVCQYVNEAIEYLSGGLASAVNFLNPELIILGGGLIQGINEFYLKTVKLTKAKALSCAIQKTEFKKAKLEDYSGVIGASLLEENYLCQN